MGYYGGDGESGCVMKEGRCWGREAQQKIEENAKCNNINLWSVCMHTYMHVYMKNLTTEQQKTEQIIRK